MTYGVLAMAVGVAPGLSRTQNDVLDLTQNAVVLAWFAWQAATTADRIPRP